MPPHNTYITLIFTVALSGALAANILDLIYWDIEKTTGMVEKRNGESEEDATTDDNAPQKTCLCNGPSCLCCIDFNITYIDLGGPGCVNMKYISREEGVALNVSYGDSLLQSARIQAGSGEDSATIGSTGDQVSSTGGPSSKPTCISLLGSLAQVCARFNRLVTAEDGLKGCLVLEPKLLGDVQMQLSVGCFSMGPDGMHVDEAATAALNGTIIDAVAPQNTTQVTGNEGINEEEILAAVNESAQQGLEFFGTLLGINFSGRPSEGGNVTSATEETSTVESED